MITLRIKLSGDQWIVANEGYEGVGGSLYNDPAIPKTLDERRAELLALIEPNYPDIFTLEWQPEELRGLRLAEITERTRALLRGGFAYSGLVFPCDASAQAYYNLLRIELRDEAEELPVVIGTLDDQGDVSLENAPALGAFLDAAADWVRATRDGDASLKRALRQAQTVEDINAVVDDR